jgi:hypothetical protein
MRIYEISNDNGVKGIELVTTKDLIVSSTMLPYRNIHKVLVLSLTAKHTIKLIMS